MDGLDVCNDEEVHYDVGAEGNRFCVLAYAVADGRVMS